MLKMLSNIKEFLLENSEYCDAAVITLNGAWAQNIGES